MKLKSSLRDSAQQAFDRRKNRKAAPPGYNPNGYRVQINSGKADLPNHSLCLATFSIHSNNICELHVHVPMQEPFSD